MPPVNIYTKKERIKPLEKRLSGLREFIAKELSCGDRKLNPDEISLRILIPEASLPISDTELEINAYVYPERVRRQDEICVSIRDYLQRECPEAGSVYVWLILSELGHSG